MTAEPEEMMERWEIWLRNNPDAEEKQRQYAHGVIDGLLYATCPEALEPAWPADVLSARKG